MSTLAILLLAGQVAAPSPPSSNVCVATTVTAEGQRPGREAPAFSARDTLDVQIQTRLRPVVKGDHLLRLKLLTPRGYHYQTISVPVSLGSRTSGQEAAENGADSRTTRVVPGYPKPLEVQAIGGRPRRRGGSRDAATARLPVAGTSIALGSLFGEWTVVPYLDDETAPCGPSSTFEIRD